MLPSRKARIVLVEYDPRLTVWVLEQLSISRWTVVVRQPSGPHEPQDLRADIVVICGLVQPAPDTAAAWWNRCERACVVLTPSDDPGIRTAWIEWGADDCLSFPCCAVELVARMRRCAGGVRRDRDGLLVVGRFELNLQREEARLDGNPLHLTGREFALLSTLARRPGQVFSREELLELTHGTAEDAFDRSIDVGVSRLRAKLGDDPRHPRLLRTVRGRGYTLSAD